jgi:heterodisulfide reductase subunit C
MKEFGYKISASRQIDFDKIDHSLYRKIIENEPSMRLCIDCGSCSATCTAGNITDFSIRKMNLMIRRGETVGLQKEFANCMLCGKCTMICPRGVNTRNIILTIRKILNN